MTEHGLSQPALQRDGIKIDDWPPHQKTARCALGRRRGPICLYRDAQQAIADAGLSEDQVSTRAPALWRAPAGPIDAGAFTSPQYVVRDTGRDQAYRAVSPCQKCMYSPVQRANLSTAFTRFKGNQLFDAPRPGSIRLHWHRLTKGRTDHVGQADTVNCYGRRAARNWTGNAVVPVRRPWARWKQQNNRRPPRTARRAFVRQPRRVS